jgi:hypothetical protein
MCVKLFTYQNFTKMHGQKNIDFNMIYTKNESYFTVNTDRLKIEVNKLTFFTPIF